MNRLEKAKELTREFFHTVINVEYPTIDAQFTMSINEIKRFSNEIKNFCINKGEPSFAECTSDVVKAVLYGHIEYWETEGGKLCHF